MSFGDRPDALHDQRMFLRRAWRRNRLQWIADACGITYDRLRVLSRGQDVPTLVETKALSAVRKVWADKGFDRA